MHLFICIVSRVASFHFCSDISVNYKDLHYKHNGTYCSAAAVILGLCGMDKDKQDQSIIDY